MMLVLSAWLGCPEKHNNNELSDTDLRSAMQDRFDALQSTAAKSILVHVHIPKAGGTALSAALSSNCKCLPERPIVDGVSQANCSKCKGVKGNNGMQVAYTMSRSTGWKLGVHSPLAVMRYILTRSEYDVRAYGVNTTYIVMLRDPFDRFISEATNWVGRKGQAVDWSVKLTKGNETKYFKGVNLTYANGNDGTDYIKQYASLPANFILHNRQTKMIGGSVYDFQMSFDSKVAMGSRWVPTKSTKPNYISKVYDRAARTLTEDPEVILTLQERFAESICILEVLYGHLYRFNWEDSKHSHNTARNFSVANTSYTSNEQYRSVYKIWAKRNEADSKLYKAAARWFDVQFQVAMSVLKRKLDAKRAKRSDVPHCLEFLS